MAQVISADEIKKTLLNYSPDQAESFHRESARKADQEFEKELLTTPYRDVVLLSGGTASGKTEFLVTQLMSHKCVIFDATLSTEKGAEIKLKKIIKAKKTPIIYAVIPDDLKRSFVAFLNRDRKFSDTHFYTTHCGSRKTLLWIVTNYPKIKINIIESSYTKDQKLQFKQAKFENRSKLIQFVTRIQMTENDIITYISSSEK